VDNSELNEVKNDLKQLLYIINPDKDGSYFICEENKEFIEELIELYG
jgi:hypothetical protein